MDLKISIDNEVYNHFLNNTYSRADIIAVHTALFNSERKEVSREDKLIDLANAIESDDSGYWTNKRISSALRNI